MVAPRFCCDRNRLRALLDDQLSRPEQTDAIQHIETCSSCRQQLETLAADPEWWNNAHTFLSDVLDENGEPERHSAPTSSWTLLGEFSDAEFCSAFLEPSDNPAMLGRLSDYEILEVVGRGGMGLVLKGYDGELNRYVAVKVLAPQLAGSVAARRRFAREAQAAAAVVHPHVVAIHGVDASGKLPYLVMPLVAGESLQQRIDRCGSLAVHEVLRISMQAARGLAAAHSQGLVHRDVKPANILLEKGVDRVMLTDFGLARAADDASLTRSGLIPGTPQYMSPEQAKGEPADHRSDLFSLGSVLYTMCAGRPPFRAETSLGVLRRVCDDRPRPIRETNPDIPDWLAGVIERLHAKGPAKRYQSAAHLAELLEQCLAHTQRPTAVDLPAGLPRAWGLRSRHGRRWPWAVAATLLVGGITFAVTEMLGVTSVTRSDVPETSTPDSSVQEGRELFVEGASRPSGASIQVQAAPDTAVDGKVNFSETSWSDGVTAELLQIDGELFQLERQLPDPELHSQ